MIALKMAYHGAVDVEPLLCLNLKLTDKVIKEIVEYLHEEEVCEWIDNNINNEYIDQSIKS